MKVSIEKVAARVVWWKKPEETMKYPEHLIAHAMAHGTLEDLQLLEKTFGIDAFKAVLKKPLPGIFDERSWVFWHIRFKWPVGEMPKRVME